MKIIISVTNDLIVDQRVHKVCLSLHQNGHQILLVGRKLPHSAPIFDRPYATKRMKLWFSRSFLFYAEYNIRLFLLLCFSKADVLLSNDLDSLPANYFAAKIRGRKLVYDSHELFSEVPELQAKPLAYKFWLGLESFFMPKVKNAYTVCQSIADYYYNKYGTSMKVVRNLPMLKPHMQVAPGLDSEKDSIILYQGALNLGRGLELAIQAMEHLGGCKLWLVGDGDVRGQLERLVQTKGLQDKVVFLGQVPFSELYKITEQVQLGISIEENLGLNYYYMLPNKLFDYIQANVPVLASPFPEIKRVIDSYQIGTFIDERTPEAVARVIDSCFADVEQYKTWKTNLHIAAKELCWENEEQVLGQLFTD